MMIVVSWFKCQIYAESVDFSSSDKPFPDRYTPFPGHVLDLADREETFCAVK